MFQLQDIVQRKRVYHCLNCVSFQLVLNVSTPGLSIQNSNPLSLLPSATNVINMADTHDRSSFVAVSQLKEEPMDVQTYDINIDDVKTFVILQSFITLQYLHHFKRTNIALIVSVIMVIINKLWA